MTKVSQKEIPTFYQVFYIPKWSLPQRMCVSGGEEWGSCTFTLWNTHESSRNIWGDALQKRLKSLPSVALQKSSGSWLAWWLHRKQENHWPINRQKASQDHWCLILSLIHLGSEDSHASLATLGIIYKHVPNEQENVCGIDNSLEYPAINNMF